MSFVFHSVRRVPGFALIGLLVLVSGCSESADVQRATSASEPMTPLVNVLDMRPNAAERELKSAGFHPRYDLYESRFCAGSPPAGRIVIQRPRPGFSKPVPNNVVHLQTSCGPKNKLRVCRSDQLDVNVSSDFGEETGGGEWRVLYYKVVNNAELPCAMNSDLTLTVMGPNQQPVTSIENNPLDTRLRFAIGVNQGVLGSASWSEAECGAVSPHLISAEVNGVLSRRPAQAPPYCYEPGSTTSLNPRKPIRYTPSN